MMAEERQRRVERQRKRERGGEGGGKMREKKGDAKRKRGRLQERLSTVYIPTSCKWFQS